MEMGTITRRIERLKNLSAEYARPAPPVPKSVKIELTARCDMQCSFCASHTRPGPKTDMRQNFFERIVTELREAGVEQLGVFYIGESFLCDWLPEAIRYAKEICGYPYVFLTTNGRLATPTRVHQCLLAGLDSLKFTINFNSPAQLHQVTGADENQFDVIVSNLKRARWLRDCVETFTGHRCAIYASSLRYDDRQEAQMRDLAAEILPHVDEHYFLPLFGEAGNPGPAPIGAKLAPAVKLRKPLPCWSLFTEAHITSNGRLAACCLDHSGRFHMGDLNRVSFLDAWHSPRFQKLRDAHLRGDVSATACASCIAYS